MQIKSFHNVNVAFQKIFRSPTVFPGSKHQTIIASSNPRTKAFENSKNKKVHRDGRSTEHAAAHVVSDRQKHSSAPDALARKNTSYEPDTRAASGAGLQREKELACTHRRRVRSVVGACEKDRRRQQPPRSLLAVCAVYNSAALIINVEVYNSVRVNAGQTDQREELQEESRHSVGIDDGLAVIEESPRLSLAAAIVTSSSSSNRPS